MGDMEALRIIMSVICIFYSLRNLSPVGSVISKVWLCLNCLILGQNVKTDDLLCKGEMPFGIVRNSR